MRESDRSAKGLEVDDFIRPKDYGVKSRREKVATGSGEEGERLDYEFWVSTVYDPTYS